MIFKISGRFCVLAVAIAGASLLVGCSDSTSGSDAGSLSSTASSGSLLGASSSSAAVAPSWCDTPGNCGTFVDTRPDANGREYRWTKINGVVWMAENLDYGVLNTLGNYEWDDYVAEKKCADNLEANCRRFGALYSWAEANGLPKVCNGFSCAAGGQGICPVGWHVPGNGCELLMYLDTLDARDGVGDGADRWWGSDYCQMGSPLARVGNLDSALNTRFAFGILVEDSAGSSWWTDRQSHWAGDEGYAWYLFQEYMYEQGYYSKKPYSKHLRCVKDTSFFDIPNSSATGVSSSAGELPVADWCATPGNCGTFTDMRPEANNRSYRWTKIGGQTWMAENLAYPSTYCTEDSDTSCITSSGPYRWIEAMALPYDCRYHSNFDIPALGQDSCVVDDRIQYQGICPAGWHLPGKGSWETLRRAADNLNGGLPYDESQDLKDSVGWLPPLVQGSNGFAFSGQSDLWLAMGEYSPTGNVVYGYAARLDPVMLTSDVEVRKSDWVQVRCVKDEL